MHSVCVVIPTKRRPPLATLENYQTNRPTIVVADPRVWEENRDYYEYLDVVVGRIGMGAQSAYCYQTAFAFQYPRFFRVDDDLTPKTFVHRDGSYPSLDEVIDECVRCYDETKTTLVGLMNTSNRGWMNPGYRRTYGLIHGGANLAISSPMGSEFIEPTLYRGEDVYRTCAHRQHDLVSGGDGSVGRVGHVGFDKRGSTITAGQSSIEKNAEQVEASRKLILERFPGYVTCDGTRLINGGRDEILNWRFKKFRVAG